MSFTTLYRSLLGFVALPLLALGVSDLSGPAAADAAQKSRTPGRTATTPTAQLTPEAKKKSTLKKKHKKHAKHKHHKHGKSARNASKSGSKMLAKHHKHHKHHKHAKHRRHHHRKTASGPRAQMMQELASLDRQINRLRRSLR